MAVKDSFLPIIQNTWKYELLKNPEMGINFHGYVKVPGVGRKPWNLPIFSQKLDPHPVPNDNKG